MKPIVCIVNCIGYLGSELSLELLKKGFHIRGLVPSIFNARDVDHINSLEHEYPGKIELYEYDPVHQTSFKELFCDIDHVYSVGVASIKDDRDRKVNVMSRIIESALAAKSVKSVIATIPWEMETKKDHFLMVDLPELGQEDLSYPVRCPGGSNPLHFISVHHGLLLGPPQWDRYDCQGTFYIQQWLKRGHLSHSPLFFSDVRDVTSSLIEALRLEPIQLDEKGRYYPPANAEFHYDLIRLVTPYHCSTANTVSSLEVQSILKEVSLISPGKDSITGDSDESYLAGRRTSNTVDISSAISDLRFPCDYEYRYRKILQKALLDTAQYILQSRSL